MTANRIAAAAAVVAAVAAGADAVGQEAPHAGHAEGATAASPAVAAYAAASARMHEDMAIDFTGDADVDFALGMIPHHQGAIDMARVVLEYGQDPRIRGLAEAVVAAQEAEIAFLRDWLAARGY